MIRSWDYGILYIETADSRGTDTRFAKDSIVMILDKVDSYHDLLQMVGRSSRSRKACECILFNKGSENDSSLIDRLKRHNIVALQNMENLLKILESK